MVAWLKIIGFCTLASVVYGVVHDQITARVCIEYFTIGHPRLFPGDSPTLHGLAWGIIATWWMGAVLGLGTAVVGRARVWPRLAWRDFLRPVIIVLLVMFITAAIAGVIGALAFDALNFRLADWLAEKIDPSRHIRFFAVGCAHSASYLVGAIGGVVLWMWALVERGRRAVREAGSDQAGHTDLQ